MSMNINNGDNSMINSVSSTLSPDGGGLDPFKERETIKVRNHRKATSSNFRILEQQSNLIMLPSFQSTSAQQHEDLLKQKLQQCSMLFDFSDPMTDLSNKEIKKSTLLELIAYVDSNPCCLSQAVYYEVTKMVSVNIFRTISPPVDTCVNESELEENDQVYEPSWPHMQLVYQLLLRVLESSCFQPALAKRYIDHSFVSQLLELFNSEDFRERESLKIILHRIYGKFLGLRAFIRKLVNFIFLRFIYEDERFSGISELLEVYGSIINGFAVPLKEEHKQFLLLVLLPLHKTHCYMRFASQLSQCVIQFIRKEDALTNPIVKALLKFWPKTATRKEITFFSELEEIFCIISIDQYQLIRVPLYKQVASCLRSDHFQVVEHALNFINDSQRMSLVERDAHMCLPILYPAICRCWESFSWNFAVHKMAQNIKQMMETLDEEIRKFTDVKCLEDNTETNDGLIRGNLTTSPKAR